MKKIIGTMIAFYILLLFSPFINDLIFVKVFGGGVSETYLYPIYWGLVLLSGLIVACTLIIIEEIQESKQELKNSKNSENEDAKVD